MDKQGGEGTLGGPEAGINNAWRGQEQPHLARTKNLGKEMIENESELVPNTSFPQGVPPYFLVLRETSHPSLHPLLMCKGELSSSHLDTVTVRVAM